jgi:uncharacterized membrane protein
LGFLVGLNRAKDVIEQRARVNREKFFPVWGVAALPAGVIIGVIFGAFFGVPGIGASVGAAIGVSVGIALLAAAIVTAANRAKR